MFKKCFLNMWKKRLVILKKESLSFWDYSQIQDLKGRSLKCVKYPLVFSFSNISLEKTLESPLDYKEIQPVHPKGDQSWVFIGRTDAKAETPILWPPHAKSWFIGKDPDAGKDWGQKEKGMTEDEMAGWHHRLNGHGFGWTPGAGDGQEGLEC